MKDVLAKFFSGMEAGKSVGGLDLKVAFQHRHPTDVLRDVILSIDKSLADGEILIIAMDKVPQAITDVTLQRPRGCGAARGVHAPLPMPSAQVGIKGSIGTLVANGLGGLAAVVCYQLLVLAPVP